MSYCLVLQHDPAFGPGRLIPIFRDFGIPTLTVRLDEGDAVPDDFDEVRLLVLLGGTTRLTADASGQPQWLEREVEAIRPLIRADRPVLGFGLGAQIIARSAGANIVPNQPAKSAEGSAPGESAPFYGWGRVTLPFPGGTDPILFGLHDGTPMFFWHKDSFELPKLPPPPGYDPGKAASPPPTGTSLLASSPHCKNAAFRFQDHVYGFQFHPELGREDLEAIATRHGGMAGAAFGSGAIDRVRSEGQKHFAQYERLGSRLLANYVQFFKAYNPAGVKG